MANFCNVQSKIPIKTTPSNHLVKFEELEFKIAIYEKELFNLHETFDQQSQFILNYYFDISNKNDNALTEIDGQLKIHQDAANEVEILLYLIENDLNSIELKLNQILYKLRNDIEFLDVPETVRGCIYVSLFTASGCMHQMYDELSEFFTQSRKFVSCTNITNHILNIHASLVFCLEKNIAKLLEMVNAIDEMCPIVVM